MSKFILYAPNVHTGGGKTLLISLLKALKGRECLLILDYRLEGIDLNQKVLSKVFPSFISRFQAEITLEKNSQEGDIVLCFHSMPPIFSSKAQVFVYFHNKHLIGDWTLVFKEKLRVIFRLILERILSKIFYRNVNEYLVQTISMQRKLTSYYSRKMSKVTLFPFIDDESYLKVPSIKSSNVDFVYVSEGHKHKNHSTLLDAWVILANQGIFPNLTLTLSSDYKDIIIQIDKLTEKYKINVNNLGYIDAITVIELYSNAKALIFPSLIESYGLPLIEAKLTGLPIIASELDFVRDVCIPDETFDPQSDISIARAVKRFLNMSNNNGCEYNANDFVSYVFNDFKK